MIERSLKILDHYQLLDENSKLVGVELSILCPFHQETSPSCHIWLEAENYYCFGCEARGDLGDLVAHIEKVNKLAATLLISRVMHDTEGAYTGGELGAKIVLAAKSELTIPEAIEQARGFFFSLARPHWEDISHHYMIDNRGFNSDTLRRFDVRINSSGEYPIIFPVYDGGKFRGYMTRALDNREDKYRMSRGMRKTEILYGRVKPGQTVIVTEGAFDAMKTWQNMHLVGIKGLGIASPLNWSSSEAQLAKLSEAGAVISALDNDSAGQQGYEVLKRKLKIPVVRYPLPSWLHDMAELDARECQVGLTRALKALSST